MGFSVNSFCRVFSVEDKGKYSVARLAVSKKNQETGNYETTWSDNFTRFVGHAHEKIKGMNIGEKGVSIKLLNCDVTNKYDKEKKITYTNYVVFDFEDPNGSQAAPAPQQTRPDVNSFIGSGLTEDEETLPFA